MYDRRAPWILAILLFALEPAGASELVDPPSAGVAVSDGGESSSFQSRDQRGELSGADEAGGEPSGRGALDAIPLSAALRMPAGAFRLVQDSSPLRIGPQVFESPIGPTSAAVDGLDRVRPGTSLLSAGRRHIAAAPAASVILGTNASVLVTTDAGSLLGKSTSGLGVTTQKRSPIVNEPRLRSSSLGQLVASGSYWFAARPDLDTLVSKIDSRLIDDMIVIKGPYAARYGPGFGFIDFQLLATPRYEGGLQTYGRTSTDYKTNGAQWYGRQEVWGGAEDYGFRVGYSNGTGSDYRTGDGSRLPSSYRSQNFDAAIGYDFDENSSLEFTYLRQEQQGVELPNHVYDIRFLEADGFEVAYEEREAVNFDLLRIETWYNQTRFDGNNLGAGKRAFMPLLDFAEWTGFVEAQNMSTGYSAAMTWGDEGCTNLTVGTDLRYLRQNIDEFDQTTAILPSGAPLFAGGLLENYPVPDARTENPGLFFELERPVDERLTVRVGGRFDWVRNDAAITAPLALESSFADNFLEFWEVDSMAREFRLPACYVTAEYEVDAAVTVNLAGGYAERSPTMFQLYAGAPLANVMAQYATSVVFGNPHVEAEKRWQLDAGLHADYGRFRGGATGYFAWVEDYITLDYLLGNFSLPEFPLYGFVNTDLAILAGGELYAEYDVNQRATLFATAAYTAGRDLTVTKTAYAANYFGFDLTQSRNTLDEQPLPMMSPLEARLGLRLQDPCEGRYGVEFAVRVVDTQDRVASLLLEEVTPGFTVLDIRGYWRPAESVTLVAGVENLTDNKYREHLDARHFVQVYQPGFNFYSGVELNY